MVAEISILGRIVDFLSSAPDDEAIISIKATRSEIDRLDHLETLRREGSISETELNELNATLIAEQMMVIAKANAYGRLKRTSN